MSDVKSLLVKQIDSATANAFVKKHHYSGKVVQNSQLHLGVFWNDLLEGVMQFGPSLDKRKIQGLVRGSLWHEFIELNRMAFSEALPRNSESRAIAIAMRLLKKHAPQLKWVISFADGSQCGDGTIYRASGFVLTGIKKNDQIWQAPAGARFSRTSLTDGRSKSQQQEAVRLSRGNATKAGNILQTGAASMASFKAAGFEPIPGFQLRYIYFLDQTYKERLTVPVLPFSEISARGARMYKGEHISCVSSIGSDATGDQPEEGGAAPTDTLITSREGA